MGDGVPGLRGFLPGGGTGLDNLRPCPERNRVLRIHAKVIRGHIHPLADQDAFIQFTGVRQNVGCAGLRLTNFSLRKVPVRADKPAKTLRHVEFLHFRNRRAVFVKNG